MEPNKCCKSCVIWDEKFPECAVHDLNEGDCPCTNCIVKMICRDECKTFRDYEDKILIGSSEID